MTATVVLVHGAWHDARCFDKLVGELDARGIPVVALDRPGHGSSSEPLGDLEGDITAVRRAVTAIDGPVVLVGHSYGGAVISGAAAGAGNVTHLVYLTAFVLDAGESLLAQNGVGEHEPSDLIGHINFHDDGTTTVDLDIAPAAFYGDCDPDDVALALSHLQPQGSATFAGTVPVAAWRTVESTYVVCTEDRAIVPSLQRWLAQRCTHVVELRASHSPFLSMPGAVADILAPLATR